jgi:hypothetical protein
LAAWDCAWVDIGRCLVRWCYKGDFSVKEAPLRAHSASTPSQHSRSAVQPEARGDALGCKVNSTRRSQARTVIAGGAKRWWAQTHERGGRLGSGLLRRNLRSALPTRGLYTAKRKGSAGRRRCRQWHRRRHRPDDMAIMDFMRRNFVEMLSYKTVKVCACFAFDAVDCRCPFLNLCARERPPNP